MRTVACSARLLAVLATIACSSNPAPVSGNEADRAVARPASRSNDVAMEKELRESSTRSALEFVRQHRPQWLRSRGSSGRGAPAEPVVYLGDVRLGGLESLAQFPTNNIKELRYHNATDATSRWGTGHSAGAIVIIQQ